MLKEQKRMEIESVNLQPVISHTDGLPIYILTGKFFLYQTLFCIRSLANTTKEKFKYILIDDGSFDYDLIKRVNVQLPGAIVITKDQIEKNIEAILPFEKYPHLTSKRKIYPHIKKLTDIHTLSESNWKIVIDSDMLFWHEPLELINWLKKPETPIFMVDCVNSYGYSKELMEELCGKPIYDLLNVGIIGLMSSSINWNNVENWLSTLEKKEGTSYFLEQALSAMIIGDSESVILNSEDYIVNPVVQQVQEKKGKLHHYVDLSKEHYYKIGWKAVLQK